MESGETNHKAVPPHHHRRRQSSLLSPHTAHTAISVIPICLSLCLMLRQPGINSKYTSKALQLHLNPPAKPSLFLASTLPIPSHVPRPCLDEQTNNLPRTQAPHNFTPCPFPNARRLSPLLLRLTSFDTHSLIIERAPCLTCSRHR